jgi:hypothetical protein
MEYAHQAPGLAPPDATIPVLGVAPPKGHDVDETAISIQRYTLGPSKNEEMADNDKSSLEVTSATSKTLQHGAPIIPSAPPLGLAPVPQPAMVDGPPQIQPEDREQTISTSAGQLNIEQVVQVKEDESAQHSPQVAS